MDDNVLLDFMQDYNDAPDADKPVTPIQWMLFIDGCGLKLVKKTEALALAKQS